MASEIFRLEIDVVGDAVPQLKKINSQLKSQDKSLKGINSTLKATAAAFIAAFSGQVIQKLSEAADEITTINSRLFNLTGNLEDANEAFDLIGETAQNTRIPIKQVSDSYVSLGNSLKDFGFSSEELALINENLIKTFKVSGSNAEDTARGLFQLNQGFNSTRLQAEELNTLFDTNIVLLRQLADSLDISVGELKKFAAAGELTSDKVLTALLKNTKDTDDAYKNIKVTFGDVATTISNEFNIALQELNKELGQDKGFLDTFNESLKGVGKTVVDLGKSFFELIKPVKISSGVLGSDFRDTLKQVAKDSRFLKDELDEGFIGPQIPENILQARAALDKLNATADQTKTKLTDLFVGPTIPKAIEDFRKSIDQVVAGSFKRFEDQLVNLATTGKFAFKDLADSIIADLSRIAIQQNITRPLAQAFSGGASSFIEGLFNAKGNAFTSSGVQAFASGGVVNSPTVFPFAAGGAMRTGIMGEAGPEAILPLSRTSSGNLGVEASGMGGGSTVVNVINNSGNDTEVNERQTPSGDRVIDILIATSVNKGIQNGSFDRSFSNSFNINRKGRV